MLSTSRSAGAGQWPVAYPRRERVPKSQTGLAKDLHHLVAGLGPAASCSLCTSHSSLVGQVAVVVVGGLHLCMLLHVYVR